MSLFGKKDDVSSASPDADRRHGGRYGIAEAIQLMRSLPVDQNVELVVHAIRNTLESMKVHVSDIIEDAIAKEKAIHHRMEVLQAEIAEHSKQIETRKQEIARLGNELAETTTVKDRLVLAQNIPTAKVPGASEAAPPPPPRAHQAHGTERPAPPPPPAPPARAGGA